MLLSLRRVLGDHTRRTIMTRNELLQMMDQKGIGYEITEHVPVFTIEQMMEADLPYPDSIAKNLFVRDDKKRNYYLITVQEERKISLKEFQEQFGTRKLSFASENDLMIILGLIKGAVTPFGLLNDKEHIVKFYIGKEFIDRKLGIHPLENTATVWMQTNDLLKMLKEQGNTVTVF